MVFISSGRGPMRRTSSPSRSQVLIRGRAKSSTQTSSSTAKRRLAQRATHRAMISQPSSPTRSGIFWDLERRNETHPPPCIRASRGAIGEPSSRAPRTSRAFEIFIGALSSRRLRAHASGSPRRWARSRSSLGSSPCSGARIVARSALRPDAHRAHLQRLELPTISSSSSIRFGVPAVRFSFPSAVMSTSSSMRIPMP